MKKEALGLYLDSGMVLQYVVGKKVRLGSVRWTFRQDVNPSLVYTNP